MWAVKIPSVNILPSSSNLNSDRSLLHSVQICALNRRHWTLNGNAGTIWRMLSGLLSVKCIATNDRAMNCWRDIINDTVWDLQLSGVSISRRYTIDFILQVKYPKLKAMIYKFHGAFLDVLIIWYWCLVCFRLKL